MMNKKEDGESYINGFLREFANERMGEMGLDVTGLNKAAGQKRGRLDGWMSGKAKNIKSDLLVLVFRILGHDILDLLQSSRNGASKETAPISDKLQTFLDSEMTQVVIKDGKLGPLELNALRALDVAGCFRHASEKDVGRWAHRILIANRKVPKSRPLPPDTQ